MIEWRHYCLLGLEYMSVVNFAQCHWPQCVVSLVMFDYTAFDLHLANAAWSEVETKLSWRAFFKIIYLNFTKEADIGTGVKAKSPIFNTVCLFFIFRKKLSGTGFGRLLALSHHFITLIVERIWLKLYPTRVKVRHHRRNRRSLQKNDIAPVSVLLRHIGWCHSTAGKYSNNTLHFK